MRRGVCVWRERGRSECGREGGCEVSREGEGRYEWKEDRSVNGEGGEG